MHFVLLEILSIEQIPGLGSRSRVFLAPWSWSRSRLKKKSGAGAGAAKKFAGSPALTNTIRNLSTGGLFRPWRTDPCDLVMSIVQCSISLSLYLSIYLSIYLSAGCLSGRGRKWWGPRTLGPF